MGKIISITINNQKDNKADDVMNCFVDAYIKYFNLINYVHVKDNKKNIDAFIKYAILNQKVIDSIVNSCKKDQQNAQIIFSYNLDEVESIVLQALQYCDVLSLASLFIKIVEMIGFIFIKGDQQKLNTCALQILAFCCQCTQIFKLDIETVVNLFVKNIIGECCQTNNMCFICDLAKQYLLSINELYNISLKARENIFFTNTTFSYFTSYFKALETQQQETINMTNIHISNV